MRVVGKAAGRQFWWEAGPERGEVYSTDSWRFQAGALTVAGAECQQRAASARYQAQQPATAA